MCRASKRFASASPPHLSVSVGSQSVITLYGRWGRGPVEHPPRGRPLAAQQQRGQRVTGERQAVALPPPPISTQKSPASSPAGHTYGMSDMSDKLCATPRLCRTGAPPCKGPSTHPPRRFSSSTERENLPTDRHRRRHRATPCCRVTSPLCRILPQVHFYHTHAYHTPLLHTPHIYTPTNTPPLLYTPLLYPSSSMYSTLIPLSSLYIPLTCHSLSLSTPDPCHQVVGVAAGA